MYHIKLLNTHSRNKVKNNFDDLKVKIVNRLTYCKVEEVTSSVIRIAVNLSSRVTLIIIFRLQSLESAPDSLEINHVEQDLLIEDANS